MKINKSIIPIVLILLVATGLRFYKLTDQAFTHDEFSTIFRLDFGNLNDLISGGVMEDGHPAGYHLYSYFYTKAFGSSEMAVKFPIILFGIFSVLLVYIIGKKWFNTTAAIYAASFMAILQYAVAQSQIARMYGFGIPFILLMVYFWDKIVRNKPTLKYSILYVIAASICTYTHYFSLLFVVIVWATGLFLIKRKSIIQYLGLGFSIFLLFAPHLGIFFYQLSKGGIEGWLGAFEFSYFFKYISYVFHHSWVIAAVVIFPLLFLFAKNISKRQISLRWISLIWFLTPMLIGFLYSYFVNNVVHEKVLYFSFPFLLLFLASFIRKTSNTKELFLVTLILIVGTASLFIERNHQYLFNKHRYKLIAESLMEWEQDINAENLLSFKATYIKVDNYYNAKHGYTNNNTFYSDSISNIKDFISLLDSAKSEYLYFGRATMHNLTYFQVALNYFPEIVKKEYTIAGEAYLLKKSDKQFDTPCKYFEFEKDIQEIDTLGCGIVATKSEYIGTIELELDSIIFSENNFIELSLNVNQIDSIGGAKIVSSMEKNGEVIDWRSREIDEFILSDSAFNKVMYTISIPDINFEKNTRVKFFIWNPNKSNYKVSNFKITTRAGNPFIYGGTEKIPVKLSPFCL